MRSSTYIIEGLAQYQQRLGQQHPAKVDLITVNNLRLGPGIVLAYAGHNFNAGGH
jgi:hypothetical protein